MKLVLLQNAYSSDYAGYNTWPRALWALSFRKSRTGKRLSRMVPEAFDERETCIANCTPKVTAAATLAAPAELWFVQVRLAELLHNNLRCWPRYPLVVTCGSVAFDVVQSVWSGPLLALPHPAHRTLSNNALDYMHDAVRQAEAFCRRGVLIRKRIDTRCRTRRIDTPCSNTWLIPESGSPKNEPARASATRQ
jgi:hypothetical protein